MLAIDQESAIPTYQQIVLGVVEDINAGHLVAGDRLPAVRRLAADLDLAPGTVARAYGELEQRGVIASRGRRGTFVTATTDDRYGEAQDAARAYLDHVMGRLGFSAGVASEILGRELDLRIGSGT